MQPVADQVHNWFSDGSAVAGVQTPTLSEAQQYCRRLALGHYENFPITSVLLPRHLHQHFYNVYAFCRWADDLGDETGGPAAALPLLAWWREQLHACFNDGSSCHPVFVALRPTVLEFGIPRQPFDDLISAFEQDQTVSEYQTCAALLDYCTRSANPVGRIVLHLCRRATDHNLGWSDSICTGLQLANFWQDVARDLQIGRIYLPVEDRQQFAVTLDDLHCGQANERVRRLLEFEVDRAEQFLRAGLPLVHEMPGRLQVEIELFARGGLRILKRIRDIDFDVLHKRPVVTGADVVSLTLQCCLRAVGRMFISRSRSESVGS